MLLHYPQRFNSILYISLFIFLVLIIYVLSIQQNDDQNTSEKDATKEAAVMPNLVSVITGKKLEGIDEVRNCFVNALNSFIVSNLHWYEIPKTVENCAKTIRASIPFIEAGPENYEKKYYMIPRLQHINEPCSVITFGIGGEIVAEEHIKMTLPHCTLIGFDPNPEYEKLFVNNLKGKFIQTAVSGKSGSMTIFQLGKNGYQKAPGTSIRAAAELIETYHGKNRIIDILNIDIEGSEYGIFEEMMKDKIFENVCQINVEIHPVWYHDTGYTYSNVIEILKNLMGNGTFLWVKTFVHYHQFYPSYFINTKNKECYEKFLKDRLYIEHNS